MSSRPQNISATEALSRLQAGNRRYVKGEMISPNTSVDHRQSLTMGQSPFAIILTCADSRVSPEFIFDQGIGDLFTIRVAGNIVDDAVLGSIEYAAVHLGVNLVMVMGHEKCGAVGAAVVGDETQLHIDELIRAIRPAVERAKEQNPEDLLEASIRENACYVSECLSHSEVVLSGLCAQHGLQVKAAYYSLESGEVSLIN